MFSILFLMAVGLLCSRVIDKNRGLPQMYTRDSLIIAGGVYCVTIGLITVASIYFIDLSDGSLIIYIPVALSLLATVGIIVYFLKTLRRLKN